MHMQKVKVRGHSVQKLEWKRMYRRTKAISCSCRANAVGIKQEGPNDCCCRDLVYPYESTPLENNFSIGHLKKLENCYVLV